MILKENFNHTDVAWHDIVTHTATAEQEIVPYLLQHIQLDSHQKQLIHKRARALVVAIREDQRNKSSIENLLAQYRLSSDEGIALMCLAEAMLRIPDVTTRNQLMQDKLADKHWRDHLGQSDSFFVNAASWGLLLTGKILKSPDLKHNRLRQSLQHIVQRSGGWMVRKAVNHMIAFLSEHFVLADTIQQALKRARKQEQQGYRYSFDMLGEAALTAIDAEHYFNAYETAIKQMASHAHSGTWCERPSVSIKLSALHPRLEMAQRERVLAELTPKLMQLVLLAKQHHIGVTIDAEEAARLTLSLEIFAQCLRDPRLQGWDGFGLVVQAYQKRAAYVIQWLRTLAEQVQRRIPIRLVKGAYWDSEIKWAQEQGLSSYPVFTRKVYTDVNYIYCAQQLLAAPHAFYCQFATHNAHTVATILTLTDGQPRHDHALFEFQCLHGMGQQLYDQITTAKHPIPCRIYAPVGDYRELLPYLVRRLLENGANTSFVHLIVDEHIAVDTIIADPLTATERLVGQPHSAIPLPRDLYQQTHAPKRPNSAGLDLSCEITLNEAAVGLTAWQHHEWQFAQEDNSSDCQTICSPIDQHRVGYIVNADQAACDAVLDAALEAQLMWSQCDVSLRADCLQRAANLLQSHQHELLALLIREAGKTIVDAHAEVREAIDFCYYYAVQARQQLLPVELMGPTGEVNRLSLHGRGVMLCISPWNFPLAIFIGQVVAALVTGNAVIAKPAEQTPLIATRAVALLHEAGIPNDVLTLLAGSGETLGAALVADERVSGVMFTGSTATAKLIQQSLAARPGPMVPLIAETGGQNAMLVDASALPEQVVQDVILSAFGSAGQRCSALRVLFVQQDVANHIIEMLCGAMAELVVADPRNLSTDIGPVIDRDAWTLLSNHIEKMRAQAKLLYQVTLSPELREHYIAPTAFEIQSLSELDHEVFGPVLHVIRYHSKQLDDVIAQINATGFGLTLGIHSRIQRTVDYISQRVQAGNHYVNRNMIGAVVGVQPFGGQGLSGTGPKAGGPHYLPQLCHERTVSINTTAAGGNTTLLSIVD